jgi:NADP-dependent 3-hydroxy acid dehydrogenase YdfG
VNLAFSHVSNLTIIVVTGCNSGIGHAFAEVLIKDVRRTNITPAASEEIT